MINSMFLYENNYDARILDSRDFTTEHLISSRLELPWYNINIRYRLFSKNWGEFLMPVGTKNTYSTRESSAIVLERQLNERRHVSGQRMMFFQNSYFESDRDCVRRRFQAGVRRRYPIPEFNWNLAFDTSILPYLGMDFSARQSLRVTAQLFHGPVYFETENEKLISETVPRIHKYMSKKEMRETINRRNRLKEKYKPKFMQAPRLDRRR